MTIDHARDGEVMLAYQMNNEQLPLLNGFPLRLIVPGWYSTYWVKMLNDIEVLDTPDDNYWMKTAYRIPDTPRANVKPGQTGAKTVPINRMVPRSFFTNLTDGNDRRARLRRCRCAGSPSAATAAWRGWIFPSMAVPLGNRPRWVPTKDPTASACGPHRLPRRRRAN